MRYPGSLPRAPGQLSVKWWNLQSSDRDGSLCATVEYYGPISLSKAGHMIPLSRSFLSLRDQLGYGKYGKSFAVLPCSLLARWQGPCISLR